MKLKKLIPKTLVAFTVATVFVGTSIPVQAFTSYELDSDLNYKYKGAKESEFYNHTGKAYNYTGAMQDYMKQIYGTNGQSIYNSNFGSNIVDLNGYGVNTGNTYGYGYGMNYGNYTASVENSYFDRVAGGGQYYNVNVAGNGAVTGITNGIDGSGTNANSNSQSNINVSYTNNSNSYNSANGVLPNEVGDVTFPSYFADANNSYNNNISSNKDVTLSRYSDGSIGTIKVKNANLTVKAYDYSDIYQSMKKGVGHLDSTAFWNGNVTFFGHNRGSNGYFEKLKNVEIGDLVEYTTKEGTKTYKVDKIERISETDWSDLGYTSENKITLITCIANTPSKRLLVQANEVK